MKTPEYLQIRFAWKVSESFTLLCTSICHIIPKGSPEDFTIFLMVVIPKIFKKKIVKFSTKGGGSELLYKISQRFDTQLQKKAMQQKIKKNKKQTYICTSYVLNIYIIKLKSIPISEHFLSPMQLQ